MLFEKLTDKDLINAYINDFGPNNGSNTYDIPSSLEYRFRFWEQAKEEWLYKLLGEKFVIEKEIAYNVPTAKIRDQLFRASHYGNPMQEFVDAYYKKMGDIFGSDYISSYCYAYRILIDLDNLASNTIRNSIDPIVFDFGDGKKIKIENTSKPIRALGKIAKFINEEESFEKFRIEHSRILNQKKLSGILCLSIHPMDYLTMSDNNSNWTSCMSWRDNGGYRMGTVEMMNSNCVLVGYLKSTDKEWYGWNDKHWRSLFIACPDIITSIKGYPYYSEELTKICIEWIKDLAAENLSWDFNEVAKIFADKTFEYTDKNWYYFEPETNVMYNDFGCTEHWGTLPNVIRESSTEQDPYMLRMNYSGITECMWCGKDMHADYSYDESYVFCTDCCSNADDEENCECEHCGGLWSYDDMFTVGDDLICANCIDDVAAESILDFCWYYYNDLEKVYIAAENDNPCKDSDIYVYMQKEYLSESDLSPWIMYTNVEHPRCKDGIYYFNKEDLTTRGLTHWYTIYSDSYFTDKE